ncbi:UNVERIFIED_CONTAM: hypothetical protein NCL1_58899 [Trichonephila clavipes]
MSGLHSEIYVESRLSARLLSEASNIRTKTWMACVAEDCGFQILKDDEIVTSVHEESDPVDDETDEDKDNNNKNNESITSPSNADVFYTLETAME